MLKSRLAWSTMNCIRPSFLFISCLIIVLQNITPSHGVAVMSVDFGSEWMKIAIVSPGVPMEIALNKESKRKTPVAIAFRDGERTFGEDAMAVGVRFPKNCYAYLLDLLGKKVDSPIVKLFQQRFPYYHIIPDDERGTVVFQLDESTKYSIEELIAMMLTKAREIAQNSAGQPINEVVITVPGFFNQAERKAMIQSAEIAGLKVLQLMNDYTAVALNYGIFRRKDFNESIQYMMFYDMGASSTSATVVGYQLVKTKDKGFLETNPQLSILGVGFDRTLGGLDMQLRLRDYLGKKFNEMKKSNKDVFENPRSLAKLFKEAGRLKNVLSANVDHYAQVEGLIDEVDFKLLVTRDDFEKLCFDLFDRVKDPIVHALKTSGLSIEAISQVVLVGAGTRVPAVQEKLSSFVGSELSKNLNTDEAAVFGAVYKAADLSAGFKVKKFITKDGVLFPIQVTFEREVESGTRLMKRTLFGLMNPYPQKKILTFNKNLSDFEFNVGYGELDHLNPKETEKRQNMLAISEKSLGSLNLTKVSLSGVVEALEKNKGPNVESKGVKAHFLMDDSGLLNLINVELVVEKSMSESDKNVPEESPLSKLGSTISKLFTGPEETLKENLEKPEDKDEHKEGDKKDDKATDTNKTREEKEKDDKKNKDSDKPKVITLREPIATKEDFFMTPSLNEKQLSDSIGVIDKLNKNDERKRRHEGALNSLESFVFEAKTKLETDEYKLASTAEEAAAITNLCSKTSDWLDEEGFTASADLLEEKLGELKKLTFNVWARVKEHQERPEALAALNSVINGSTHFLITIKNVSAQQMDSPDGSVFTKVEIDSLEKLIRETQEWKEKAITEQNRLLPHETPKLTIKLIMEKMAFLDREVKYLVNKAKIWRPRQQEEKAKDTSTNTTDKVRNDTVDSADNVEPEETQEIPIKDEKLVEKLSDSSHESESEEAIESTPIHSPTTDKEERIHSEL
ncbi:hypoxia up-regulated Grp170 co-chaperone protein isoform X3 [Rhodnius prolixus]|uniref:hypoxia up-regulated Grp170 co-chaperone protein isoform X3 n=1 Tax=Rhodnius prolixus TaxID=13249 RepID=UPI003D18801B